MRLLTACLCLLLTACGGDPVRESDDRSAEPMPEAGSGSSGETTSPSPAEPPAPRSDAEPAERPVAPGPEEVARAYFGAIEGQRFEEAWQLWDGAGRASGMSADRFAAGFHRYREYRAEVGEAGPIEGAAGSLYVDVPVRLQGRLAGGQSFDHRAEITLRRANDVPGATPEQRRWRIVRMAVRPAGTADEPGWSGDSSR